MPAAISPIAESPDSSQRDTSATPEAISLVAHSSALHAAQPEACTSHRDVTGKLQPRRSAENMHAMRRLYGNASAKSGDG